MIHLQLHWPEHAQLHLLPQAVEYAVWVYNRLPKLHHGLSPLEIWSGIRSSHDDLRRAHVWGCPVYVLKLKMQDGHQIPKWNSKARQGLFVGFSTEHSSLVPLVLNLRTGRISPQFHVIFDDSFQTVPSLCGSVDKIDEAFAALFQSSREAYLDSEFDDNGRQLVPRPPLAEEWLDDDERHSIALRRSPRLHLPPPPLSSSAPPPPSEGVQSTIDLTHDPPGLSSAPEEVPSVSFNDDVVMIDPPPPASDNNIAPAPADVSNDPPPSTPSTVSCYPRCNRGDDWKAGPVHDRSIPHHKGMWKTASTYVLSLSAATMVSQPPPFVANHSEQHAHSHQRLRKSFLSETALWLDPWTDVYNMLESGKVTALSSYLARDFGAGKSDSPFPVVSSFEPHVLGAKTRNADNPSYEEAMYGPFAANYWDACIEELNTLVKKLDAWELVPRPSDPKVIVLPSIWTFKCKRLHEGSVKKFKACFCVNGSWQKHGVNYFESWSPIVQWATVRLMIILSLILQLETAPADITAAFLHAKLKPTDPPIYVQQPHGFFVRRSGTVLKLKRSLYGLKQAPCYFFEYLKERLEQQGIKQSQSDSCLFIGTSVIAVVYVNDILFYSPSNEAIDSLINRLAQSNIWIRREDTAKGFLGVDIARCPHPDPGPPDQIVLTQPGLTKRIVEALGLHCSHSTSIATPAKCSALPKDLDGSPALASFNYASIIGMLLYLSGHSQPDIAFSVHQCARYTFHPTRRHEMALLSIGRYLKGTLDKGLVLTPSLDTVLPVDCFPDADFAGLYGHKDSQDPHCARSRTGFVILVVNCPVIWKSKLQTEIALSTMEPSVPHAEIFFLSSTWLMNSVLLLVSLGMERPIFM
ncbi:hypothetical protein ACHAXS_005455 [Conticribra weissflogii]